MKNTIFNFFQKTSILAYFGWFSLVFLTLGSILGAQTCSNWLRHGSCLCQAHPRELFGLWHRGGLVGAGRSYRIKRGIFKNLNFRLNFLLAPESPIEFLGFMWYTHLDLCLGLGIFELPTRRKKIGLRRLKSAVGRISPEPQDSSKIRKTGHFGAITLPKTHNKHICGVWDKKNWAEKRIFWK